MKIIKNNIRIIIGILIGLTVSTTTVYAANMIFSSHNITYDNSSSSLTSTDVKGSLDELFEKANNCKKINTNEPHFDYGDPTDESPTDPTAVGHNVFIEKNGDQKSVCIIRNGQLHCFNYNNFEIEKVHIQQVFSNTIFCNVHPDNVNCDDSPGFVCNVDGAGYEYCCDIAAEECCGFNEDGSVECYS